MCGGWVGWDKTLCPGAFELLIRAWLYGNESYFSSLVLFVILILWRGIPLLLYKPDFRSFWTFEFAIFSHFLQENIIVCFDYIYSPFTF